MKPNFKKTLENSIARKSKFIDQNVQYYNDIPLLAGLKLVQLMPVIVNVYFVLNQML